MQVTETALTESASLRQNYTDTSVLDRVGVVATLPGDVRMTTEMVATFYGVDMKTVEKLVERHKDELLRNNLRVVRGDELRRLREDIAAGQGSKVQDVHSIKPKTRALTLFDRRTLLNVGMLLRDSDVANKLQAEVGFVYRPTKEYETLEPVRKTLRHLDPQTQLTVGPYRIDLYFPSIKVAVECDENGHRHYDAESESTRQRFIEDTLGCTFVRYNPDDPDFDVFELIHKILVTAT